MLTTEEMRDNYDWFQKVSKERYVKKDIEELDELRIKMADMEVKLAEAIAASEEAKREIEASFELKYDTVKECYNVKDLQFKVKALRDKILHNTLLTDNAEYKTLYDEFTRAVNDEYIKKK